VGIRQTIQSPIKKPFTKSLHLRCFRIWSCVQDGQDYNATVLNHLHPNLLSCIEAASYCCALLLYYRKISDHTLASLRTGSSWLPTRQQSSLSPTSLSVQKELTPERYERNKILLFLKTFSCILNVRSFKQD
jgi:hypothetical protein